MMLERQQFSANNTRISVGVTRSNTSELMVIKPVSRVKDLLHKFYNVSCLINKLK